MANPLYPGYFPGKPVYRDRRPWNKPEEVPITGFDETLNAAAEAVEDSPIFFPKWLIEQEKATIKQKLTLSAYAPDADDKRDVDLSHEERIHGEEDVQEAPGASIGIDFKPNEFFENPGEYLKETFIVEPWKSITSTDELQAAASAAIVTEFIKSESGPYSLRMSEDEVDLAGKKSFSAAMGKKYTSLRRDSRDYANNKTVAFFRNNRHNALNESMLDAVSYEMDQKTQWADFQQNIDKSTATQVNSAKNLVVARANVATSLRGVHSKMKDVHEQFDAGFFNPVGKDPNASEVRELKFALSKAEDSLNSVDLSASDKRDVRAAQNHISKVRAGLERFTDANGNVIDRKGLEMFLKTEGQAFYRNTFDRGVAGGLVAKLSHKTANDKNVQAALNAKDKNGKRLFTQASSNSLGLHRYLQVDHDYETINDLYQDISKGKLPTQFLWQRVIYPRIETYTPSYWIGRGVDYFKKETVLGKTVMGALEQYTGYWNQLQDQLIKKLPIVGIASRKQWEIMKRQLADKIAEIITKGIDLATEGIGLLFDRIIKVVVRFVVEKTMDFAAKVGKAFLKLDADAIEDLFVGAGKALTPVAIGCAAPIIIIIALILFLLIMFLGVLPREDATKEYAPLGELINVRLPWFGGFNAQDCALDDVLSLPYENTTTNAPAAEAFDLVNALQRGFWCYWNHHPDYDDAGDRMDLWDEIMFEFNAFPAALNECADCLFWCTWLPYVAYQNVGMDFDPSISYLGAQRMNDHFKASRTYIEPGDACGPSGVQSGDIVFWNVSAGTGWHVSMVYKIEDGVVHTIHSNAAYKNLPLMCDGSGVNNPPGEIMTVVGFGRP